MGGAAPSLRSAAHAPPKQLDDTDELEFGDSEIAEEKSSLDIVDSPESVRSGQHAAPANAPALARGQRVLAQWGGVSGGGQWFPGVVEATHASGHYSIRYDDGDFEEYVPQVLVRAAAGQQGPDLSHPGIRATEGDNAPFAPSPVPSIPSVPSERQSSSASEYGDEQFEATGGALSPQLAHAGGQPQPAAAAVHDSYSADSYSDFGSSHAPSSGLPQPQPQPPDTAQEASDTAQEASDTAYTISFEDAPPSARSAAPSPRQC